MSGSVNESGNRRIKSYVLRGGRTTHLQQRALSELSEFYCLPYSPSLIDFTEAFAEPEDWAAHDVVVEIGFGMGLATAEIAQENPSVWYLGIEVFRPGIGKLLSEIQKRKIKNIRIIEHDAVDVFTHMLPDESVAGAHVFFPDPWPKKKHHKRRLLQESFLHLICGKIRPNGYFYAVSDWEEYAVEILELCSHEPSLSNHSERSGSNGFASPVSWRPSTRFEQKGKKKSHVIREVYCTKTTP